jgi:ribonuclease BN (tRNA processing enzyme)
MRGDTWLMTDKSQFEEWHGSDILICEASMGCDAPRASYSMGIEVKLSERKN